MEVGFSLWEKDFFFSIHCCAFGVLLMLYLLTFGFKVTLVWLLRLTFLLHLNNNSFIFVFKWNGLTSRHFFICLFTFFAFLFVYIWKYLEFTYHLKLIVESNTMKNSHRLKRYITFLMVCYFFIIKNLIILIKMNNKTDAIIRISATI